MKFLPVSLTPCFTVLAGALLLASGCASRHSGDAHSGHAAATPPTLAEVQAIAEEGVIYGLPLVMNYAVNYEFWVDKTSGQYKAPFNQLFNEHRVFTYQDTAVVTPNSDTPYSFAGLDLRAEPFVITVPAVERSRYYSVQLIDWNTFNFGYIGTRSTGVEPGSYLVVGPHWKGSKPPGIRQVFYSSTDFMITVFRTQLFGSDDMPNVVKIQDGYRVEPLSAFLHQAPPPAAPAIQWPKVTAESAKTGFFEYLDFVLQFAPAGPEEKAIRSRLARIGVGPGKTQHVGELPPEYKAALMQAAEGAEKKIAEKLASIGTKINGWTVAAAFGDRKYYNGDWLLRAAAAKAGIYGNDAIEAMYPMSREDVSGEPLDGSRHNYTLTFPAGQLPPVNAFWSVTLYDGKTQLLIQNPINRYLINSPMLPGMKKNADGSLTLYIQNKSPGADKESNWLPAPNGPIYLVMRLYWPKTHSPSILPPGSGSWKPPGLVKAN